MTTEQQETLIEKLTALTRASRCRPRRWVPIEDVLSIVRQHEAEQPQRAESKVVTGMRQAVEMMKVRGTTHPRAPAEAVELLRDMRVQVVWTDKATMPIPLYERMKAAIAAMGDDRTKARIKAPGEAIGQTDLAADTPDAGCAQPSPASEAYRKVEKALRFAKHRGLFLTRNDTAESRETVVAEELAIWDALAALPALKPQPITDRNPFGIKYDAPKSEPNLKASNLHAPAEGEQP